MSTIKTTHTVSFFHRPIKNKWPEREPLSLFQVYQMVHTNRYRPETTALRAIDDAQEQRKYKDENLDYVTPSGQFSYCNDQSLLQHSGLICMDLDELTNVDDMKQRLLDDPMFETMFMFRSPRGRGLKWWVEIDLTRCDHRTWFKAIRNYLMTTYGLTVKQVDASCANPSRACFLSYDPEAYLKPELIEFF